MISVLYIDDDPFLLEIGKVYLERIGDFKVELSDSAAKALIHLETTSFDVIISDYEMPEMDGLEFLKTVRSRFGGIPFILFTGKGREEVVIQALNYGADYYLQKGGSPKPQFVELAHKILLADQRHKANLALEESERRYRDVVETQTEFISRFTSDGITIFVNEAYCRYFNKKREEVIGHRFIPDIYPEDRDALKSHFASLTIDHPDAEMIHRIIMQDGSVRWQWWNDHAFFDETGRLVEYQSVGKDITDWKQAEENLMDREHRLETLGMSIPGVIYQLEMTVDNHYRFPYVRGRLQELVGITPEEVMASPETIFGSIFPEDLDQLLININISAKKLEPWHSEFRIYCNEGIKWLYGRAIPEKHSSGGSVIWNGVIIDITEKKQVEEDLKKSENLYRAIFDYTIASTVIIAPDTTLLKVNKGFEKLIGVPISEAENNLSWTQFIHNEDIERIKQYHYARRINPAKAPKIYECRVVDVNQKTHYCIAYVDVIPDTQNSVASFVDITERKKAEYKLQAAYEQLSVAQEELKAQFDELKSNQVIIKQSEQDYRSILENIQEGYYRSDKEGNLILISPSVADILGYSSVNELYNKSITGTLYVRPEDREGFLEEIEKTGLVSNYEVLMKKKDGSQLTVITSSHKYYDIDRNFKGIEGIFRDITDRKKIEEELKKSENLYRAVFYNTGTATIIISPDTTIIMANAGWEKLTCVPRSEQENKISWTSFIHPDDVERMKQYHDTRRESPSLAPNLYECRLIDANNELHFCFAHVDIIPGTNRSVASLVDVTRRRRAEEELQAAYEQLNASQDELQKQFNELKKNEKVLLKSQELFRLLEAELPDYVIIHESDIIVFVNQEGARLMGKSPDRIIGTSVLSYAAPEYHSLIIKNIQLRHQGVIIEPYDIELIAPLGDRRWVEVRATPLYFREKPATLTVLTDITDRKRAEEALRASEVKYRSIIENVQDLIYQADLSGNLTMINPIGAKRAGYSSPEELIGKNIGQDLYADPDERKNFLSVLEEQGKVENYPLTLVARDGTLFRVTSNSHYYKDNEGKIIGIEGILHDVTERYQVEESLRKANLKLNLLSSITRHDINNQLTSLMGYLSLLEEELRDPILNQYSQNAVIAANRISSMIYFTKQYEEIGVTTPIWQNARNLIDNVREEIQLGNIALINNIPGRAEIFADPLIAKVFYNLIDNAVKYGGKITEIRFSAQQSGDTLLVLCEDDGNGIPCEDKGKILEMGYGIHTGLGLALSREILLITGITICEKGETGKGARFEINVPKEAFRFTGIKDRE